MVIMFLLGASATISGVGSVYAAVYHTVDGCHRIRPERLKPKDKNAGFTARIGRVFGAAASWLHYAFTKCAETLCCCCYRARGYSRLADDQDHDTDQDLRSGGLQDGDMDGSHAATGASATKSGPHDGATRLDTRDLEAGMGVRGKGVHITTIII